MNKCVSSSSFLLFSRSSSGASVVAIDNKIEQAMVSYIDVSLDQDHYSASLRVNIIFT